MVHVDVKRGFEIIGCLNEGQSELIEERRLKDLVKKRVEFIGFPVELHVEKSTDKVVTDDAAKAQHSNKQHGAAAERVSEARSPVDGACVMMCGLLGVHCCDGIEGESRFDSPKEVVGNLD